MVVADDLDRAVRHRECDIIAVVEKIIFAMQAFHLRPLPAAIVISGEHSDRSRCGMLLQKSLRSVASVRRVARDDQAVDEAVA